MSPVVVYHHTRSPAQTCDQLPPVHSGRLANTGATRADSTCRNIILLWQQSTQPSTPNVREPTRGTRHDELREHTVLFLVFAARKKKHSTLKGNATIKPEWIRVSLFAVVHDARASAFGVTVFRIPQTRPTCDTR